MMFMSLDEFVSIIVPTYNEAENIAEVLERIVKILDSIKVTHEIIVVDDASLDNTASIAESVLYQRGKVIRRIEKRRSLSLSVLDGIRQARGNVLIVLDGDGSHPPEIIPQLLEDLRQGYDLVIASRYIKGSTVQRSPFYRRVISKIACILGRMVTEIRDNSSGFFCIRKSALEDVNVAHCGFKIGLEIFVKAKINSFKEIPYVFVNRKRGRSKFDFKAVVYYLYQVILLLFYKWIKT
ncbi:MAG: polyprenol monophosphomannose synthase [Candidatus Omnitrophica bacterium]|nr:polyprenol monophosphomannose synthase [Candidatus Omnitrophota bacterium]